MMTPRITTLRTIVWLAVAAFWVAQGSGIAFIACIALPWLWCDL